MAKNSYPSASPPSPGTRLYSTCPLLPLSSSVAFRPLQHGWMDDPALSRDDPVPEHGGAHGRVLGQGEGVGRPPEHGGVVVDVGDLDDDRDGPPAPRGQHRAPHLGQEVVGRRRV